MRRSNFLAWSITCAICIMLLAIAAWWIAGCPSAKSLDWKVQASYITADGKVTNQIPFTLCGKLISYRNSGDVLRAQLSLPDSFPYLFSEEIDAHELPGSREALSHFSSTVICHDRAEEVPAFAILALNMQKGSFIIAFDHGYLVGSVNESMSADSILEDFTAFVKLHPIA